MKKYFLMCLLASIVGCGKNNTSTSNSNSSAKEEQNQLPQTPDSGFIDSKLNFCSKLEFTKMPVPKDMTTENLNAFALALNISSTFEGHEKWKNITNSFDGQGLSLGLLNQTLGTESLQPLLLEMLQAHRKSMSASFSNKNFTSLEKMILSWKDRNGINSVLMAEEEDLFTADSETLSSLDKDDGRMQVFAVSDAESVKWALDTLYKDTAGKTFKADWKSELQALCVTPEYRSIQFQAARYVHEKAKGYMTRFSLTQLKSYLFLFDIVVQNGGFYQKNFTEFTAFMKKNPNATELQKLSQLLTSRLVQVKDEFKADVKARKQSLIDGSGKVHGTQRNYPVEFCYTHQ